MGFDQALLEIYGELDRDRLMELVVGYARHRLAAGGSSIFLRDDITGRYVLRGTTGLLESEDLSAQRIEYAPGEGLTGWIAKTGRPLRITNVKDNDELRRIADDLVWSKKYSEISAKPGQAYVGVPILSREGDAVIGVLRVSAKAKGGQFDERDEALLSQVAAMVSIAIENSQRYEREKRRARYFWLLLDISSELDPRRPIAEMLRGVVDRVREGFRTEACLIYLQTEDDVHRVKLRAASGLPGTLVGQLEYVAGEGITGYIVQTGTTVQVREPAALQDWADPHIAAVAAHLPSGVCRSYVGVPLRLGAQVLGTLELVNKVPSSPGHRDWFTDDDEGYLRLLSTAIGGVLEGARYLETLKDVGVTTMRMQRVASFGSLAQRILHEAANPLAVARLATTNLRAHLDELLKSQEREGELRRALSSDQSAQLARRMDVIESSLNEVSDKLLNLVKSSQRVGFVRTATEWNSVVREVLIWLAAERQQRGVDTRAFYGDLPPLDIEPNELFGVIVTGMRMVMDSLDPRGGVVEVHTSLVDGRTGAERPQQPVDDGQCVRTEILALQAPLSGRISAVLESEAGAPEKLSPLYFEWELAQETVRSQYGGTLTWDVWGQEVRFVLDLPLE
ncbi:MAG TPA: GAF domain-containing sensor histidine kinase [Chloroflexi bacterium]|nr:GAF domain-containing sensor histidine kinase [Chloroflexota bacterium]